MRLAIDDACLPIPEMEYRFHAVRNWRFDFCWPAFRLALEVEGGTWGRRKSRHITGPGYEEDCRKYSEAAMLGWCVVRVTSNMIASGEAIELLSKAMKATTILESRTNKKEDEEWFVALIPSDSPSGFNILARRKGEPVVEGETGIPASRFEVLLWHKIEELSRDNEQLRSTLERMRANIAKIRSAKKEAKNEEGER